MNCYLPWNLKDMTSISSEKLQKNIKQQTSYIDLYRTELMKESLRFNIASLLKHVCLNRESFGTDELSKKATDCLLVFLHATVALKNSYFAPTDVENPAVGKCAKNLHRLMVENVKSTMRYIDYSVLLDYAHGRITEDEILDQRIKIHAEVFPEEETFNVCTNEKVNDAFFTLVDLETVKAKFFVDFDVQRNADIEDELCRRLSLIPRSYDKFASSQYGVIGETKPYVNTPFIKYGGNYYSFVTTYALNLISPVVEEFYPEQEEEDQYVIEDETPIDETPVEEVPELVPAPMVQPEEPEPEIQEDIPQPEEPVPAIDPEPPVQERPAESEEDSEYEEPEEELEEDLEEDDVEEEETEEDSSEEPEFEDDEFEADPDEDEEELEEEEPEEDEFEDTESDEEDPYELSDDDTETEQDAEDAPEEEAEPEVEDQEEPAELFENPEAEEEDEIPFDEPEMTEATSDEEDDEEFLDEPKPEPAADRPVEPQPVLIPTSAYNPYDDSDDDDFEEVADNDSLRSSEDSAYTETDEYAYPDEFEEDNSNSLEAEMEEEEVYEVAEDQDDEDSEKASFPDEPYYDEEPYTALVSPDTYAYLDEAKATEFADSQVFQDADDEDAYEDDFDDPDEPQDVEEPDPYGGESLFSIADDDDDDTVHPEEETSEQTESIFTDNTDEEEQLPEPEPEAPVVEEPVAEPEPEPEPVVEPEPEPEPAPAKPATLPLLEQILQFSPSKNNPITQYLNGCSEEQKIDIVKTIEQARKKWLIDGKGKMFTIPDTNISIALFSETQDPMEAIQRAENIGAVMYALQKDSWNSLELSYDPAGQLSKADFKRISRSNFSDWEWKVVEKIGMRLIERRGK